MTTDLKDKDKQEEKKETKKRKSFVPPELSTYYQKQEEKKIRKKRITKNKSNEQVVKSSLGFPSEKYRLMTTKLYKELGFTTMKSFFMTLVELVNEDEELKNNLKKKSIELKKR